MGKFRFSLALLLLLLGSGLAWVGIAHAQSFLSETASTQKVNSSLYSTGQNVDVEGTVNGDVYCAGQNVTIDATVHGDVLCVGRTVTVNGHIDGSLRVIAQTLVDGASVGRSFSAAAQTATITKGATVGSDASFVGEEFSMNGHVGRDTTARATTMNINGTVGRNITYGGTNLNIWSKARIVGALDYSSQQTASISKSAVVHGGINHTTPTAKTQTTRAAFASWASSFLYVFASMLFFGLLLVLLLPQTIRAISEESVDHLGRSLLNALGLVILEPIILIVLFVSFIGVPLAIAAILLFILLGFFSIPITAYYIGMLLMSRSEHAVLIMLVGTFVLTILLMLPVVGVLAAIFTYFIGTGAIVLALRKYLPTPVYKVK